MFDPARQDAIRSAVLQACDAFRGVCGPMEYRDLVLAMLLVRFLSDFASAHRNQAAVASTDASYWVPDESRFDRLVAARDSADLGKRIDAALAAIEQANEGLRGVFQGISFDSTVLGNVEQKRRVLGRLLDAVNVSALNFGEGSLAKEAAAFACDSLIKHTAEIGGRWGGEFYTPPELSQLLARLMEPTSGEAIGDPCCGTGSLLIAGSQFARARSGQGGCTLFGQEKNGSTWALAKMNMVLHGETHHRLEWGDTLRDPKLLDAAGGLTRFDVVVSTPPFSLRDWGHEMAERDVHQRYRRGVPPRMAGDFAFISHMVETLAPAGRMAAVVTLGVLFRTGAERQIREQLVRENLIDAVIALPTKMFAHTAIPVAILVLRKRKADDGVMFIDASHTYQHGKTRNVLRESDLSMIEGIYRRRQDVAPYARLVFPAEIAANDFNLSVARYVAAEADEELVDLDALRAERFQLKSELARLEAKLSALLEEAGHA
ncbi:MAG: class I SAM-dependent DNA methyltransferase [Hydrogenophaga sp.]|nr:class I SAM-dependent DNA methyltransferase [Hydrogenophaga sp.]